jgi:cupin fold WbuC family metalloprotein
MSSLKKDYQSGKWLAQSDEVFCAPGDFSTFTSADLDELKERAAATARHRCRICLHPSPNALLHDMVIVHGRDVYVRPHRHRTKPETLIVLEGEGTYIEFDLEGRPNRAVKLSTLGVGGASIVRVPAGTFHSLTIESEWLVFCESTLGPFDPEASEPAPWSPAAENALAVGTYMTALRRIVDSL